LYDQYVIKSGRGRKVQTRSAKYTYKDGVKYTITERQMRNIVFNFAYLCWRKIKSKGVEPTFFVSDAVVSTIHDKRKIVLAALRNTKGVQIVSS
jgi:hypothetical protein